MGAPVAMYRAEVATLITRRGAGARKATEVRSPVGNERSGDPLAAACVAIVAGSTLVVVVVVVRRGWFCEHKQTTMIATFCFGFEWFQFRSTSTALLSVITPDLLSS